MSEKPKIRLFLITFKTSYMMILVMKFITILVFIHRFIYGSFLFFYFSWRMREIWVRWWWVFIVIWIFMFCVLFKHHLRRVRSITTQYIILYLPTETLLHGCFSEFWSRCRCKTVSWLFHSDIFHLRGENISLRCQFNKICQILIGVLLVYRCKWCLGINIWDPGKLSELLKTTHFFFFGKKTTHVEIMSRRSSS